MFESNKRMDKIPEFLTKYFLKNSDKNMLHKNQKIVN